MEDSSQSDWNEVEDRVFCKIDPFTMQAMIMKVERKGIAKQYLQRKRYEKILKSLTIRYAKFDDTCYKIKEEGHKKKGAGVISETKEKVVNRLALGLLRIRCSLNKNVAKLTKSSLHDTIVEELDDEKKGMVAKMSRNRWQVAVGMVMGMAKMASHNIQDEHEPFSVGDLSFDLNFFKANKNVIVLTADSKFVLSQVPEKRTKEQIEDVIKNLYSMGLKSFNDYPKDIQHKLIRVARYEVVTPQRVIVRQGCPAENLYFLINGEVLIMKRIRNPRTQKDSEKSLILQKGATFGELEMVNRIQRSATAISYSNVQLLSIECSELHNVFTSRKSMADLPDHVKFLKKCKFMHLWPIERLADSLDYCAPYFFKRNTLMVEDIENTDWIFIIRSGLCRVIRKLWKPLWRPPKRCELTGQMTTSKNEDTDDDVFQKRFAIYYPLYARTSRIFGGKAGVRKTFLNSKVTAAGKDKPMKKTRKKCLPDEMSTGLSLGVKTKRRTQTSGIPENKKQPKTDDKSVTDVRTKNEKCTELEQAFLAIGFQDYKPDEKQDDDLGSGEGDEPVYIQIDTLRPYDVFGLDTLVFDKYYDHPSHPGLSLASSGDEKGVEVVLLSKSYFVEHASEQVAWRVRKMAKSYPEAEVLEREIERCRLWGIYKRDVISEVLEKKLKTPKISPWK